MELKARSVTIYKCVSTGDDGVEQLKSNGYSSATAEKRNILVAKSEVSKITFEE